jgi:putative polyketide hydroxylase
VRGGAPDARDALTPAPDGRATQDRIEPILRSVAEARGGDLRFSMELVALEQHADRVVVRLLDRKTGRQQTVEARYVAAADGAQSTTRTLVGIDRESMVCPATS